MAIYLSMLHPDSRQQPTTG